ncbi:hypothetical protein [Streptomyces rubiginosohelvolus]|uniref:Uncharacterized protein n=1 Tax=Streptomyces rubiginosohelvolus TaxID=67362 RepID=A0ABQ3BPL9_9ACTN|nr:hypothetical protein [Streptomyces pluricolorescens]GGZ52980.1 hypothetical protein GCM10010328_29730 [Streptomyces pluricolorescens]
MSTETIGTAPTPTPEPPTPKWKRSLQLAANATWKAVGISTAEPFYTGQKTWGRTGGYVGEIGYLSLAPLLEIAEEYDVPVSETPAPGGGTTWAIVVPVDGINVHIWTSNPDDAPTAADR